MAVYREIEEGLSSILEDAHEQGLHTEERAGDPLTSLFTMGEFLHRAGGYVQEVMRREPAHVFQLLFFNFCNFKLYNVKNGSEDGDDVLLYFSELLRTHFSSCIIARLADDHFVVLSDKSDNEAQLRLVHDKFSVIYHPEGLELKIGIYQISSPEERMTTVCDYARIACDSIRNSVDQDFCYYQDEMRKELEIQEYVTRHLDQAIQAGEICVYYQPVVRTVNRLLCGFEALARWQDPTYGFLSPAVFIPALEDSRQIHKLDLCMVTMICRNLRRTMELGTPVVPVSFNLSRLDFTLCDIFAEIEEIRRTYQIPVEYLCVEITESVMLGDAELIRQTMSRFQEAGYQVWMDDFGSGFSSLNVLKDYEFDELKLDMGFLANFSRKSREIVKAIVSMAKRIGIRTLAEGVETEEQFEFLRSIGCEKVQGYYFGKPMPKSDALRSVQEKKMTIEPWHMRSYYEAIGRLDFITDRALALFEMQDNTIHILYVNEAYQRTLDQVGSHDRAGVLERLNGENSRLAGMFRNFYAEIQEDDRVYEMDYIMRGNYMRISARRIAKTPEKAVFHVEIIRVASKKELEYTNAVLQSEEQNSY